MHRPKIFVSTLPFGEIDHSPREALHQTGWEILYNPLSRKLTPEEVAEFAKDVDGIVASTENLQPLIEANPNLKIISRVGIGLDSVPLALCRKKQITVCYTPDAVTMGVAEMVIGAMIAMTRYLPQSDQMIRKKKWKRLIGKRLEHSVIGIIGFGRVGYQVARLLTSFQPQKILVNDLKDKTQELETLRSVSNLAIEQVEKNIVYQHADILTLHLPLSPKTRHLFDHSVLKQMKSSAYLLNYARGEIVDEVALYQALLEQKIAGAVLDVFEKEPYQGPLTELENIVLTAHMGSCAEDCRFQMELQATQEIIRFFQNQPLQHEVPWEEYAFQSSLEEIDLSQ